MLIRLRKDRNPDLLFISYDISIVRYVSHQIGAMYLDTLAEEADTEEVFANTLHPYAQSLFASFSDFKKGMSDFSGW